jgi:long-chain fatty acid transport protein
MPKFSGRLMITGIASVLFSGSALAGGFAVREQSAEGLGSAFAGIAAGTDGLSAMFWNPATISQHNGNGYISENNASLILPYSKSEDGVGGLGGSPNSGNIGQSAIVPASYSVYGLTDEITLGLAMTAPYGLGTDADAWAGSPNGSRSKIFSLNVNPAVAYKPLDWLTLAVGVEGEYFSAKLKSETPTEVQLFRVKADDIAFGFTAGILLEPSDNLDIGIGFRSSMNHKLEGDGFAGAYVGDMSATIKTPETVTLGLKYHASEQWTFMGGAEWTNWSRLKSLDISLDGVGSTLSTPYNWKDSWFFSLGGEYALDDAWTLRAGAAYEKSPVTDATRGPRLPDNDRIWLSVGASYKVNEWLTANVGYSHIFVKDGDVALGAPVPLTASFDQHIDIVAASATIDW